MLPQQGYLLGITHGDWLVALSFVASLIGQWYLLGYRVKTIEKWIIVHENDTKTQLATQTAVFTDIKTLAAGQEERLKTIERFMQLFVQNALTKSSVGS